MAHGEKGVGAAEKGLTGFEDLDNPGEGTGGDDDAEDQEGLGGSPLLDEDVRAREELANEYEVEEILDKRVRESSSRLEGPRVEYLVKWKHCWDDRHNSWESAANVAQASELVQAFENRQQMKQQLTEMGDAEARAAAGHAAAVRAERFKAQEAARQAAEARARESRPQTRAARAKVLREKRENKREGVLH